MSEKIGHLVDEDLQQDRDRVGFAQVHLSAPRQKKVPAKRPPKKKDGYRHLNSAACISKTQAGLHKFTVKEWQGKELNACLIRGVGLADAMDRD